MADISLRITKKSLKAKRKAAIKTIKAQTKEKIRAIKMEYAVNSERKKIKVAERAQKNYLRAEKKQLQTVPLEEADVAIVDTALLSAGVTPDSFDFEEQRFSRLPQPAPATGAVCWTASKFWRK